MDRNVFNDFNVDLGFISKVNDYRIFFCLMGRPEQKFKRFVPSDCSVRNYEGI